MFSLLKMGLRPLTYLENRQYDLLVTDYNMPSLNGLYLLTISRAMWPHIPVVMVSGDLGQVRARAIRYGAYAWITKPYHVEQLMRTIDDALTGVQAKTQDPEMARR
jgi:CheY-like chemotaxis protein